MFTKNKILFCIIVLNFFAKIVLAQCTDTRYYIQTPRSQDVPDTYQTCEFFYPSDRAGWDNYYAIHYPDATQIKLPGSNIHLPEHLIAMDMHGGMLITVNAYGLDIAKQDLKKYFGMMVVMIKFLRQYVQKFRIQAIIQQFLQGPRIIIIRSGMRIH